MKSLLVRCTVVMMAAGIVSGLPAQAVVAGDVALQSKTTAKKDIVAPVDAIIAVNLHDVRLDEALRTVTRQAGVMLTYAANRFPGNMRVSLISQDITVRSAVEKLIARTGFEVQVRDASEIALVAKTTLPHDKTNALQLHLSAQRGRAAESRQY